MMKYELFLHTLGCGSHLNNSSLQDMLLGVVLLLFEVSDKSRHLVNL